MGPHGEAGTGEAGRRSRAPRKGGKKGEVQQGSGEKVGGLNFISAARFHQLKKG